MVPAKIRKMCTNKKRFARRLDAERVGSFWGNRAYRCPNCRFWHLTSK